MAPAEESSARGSGSDRIFFLIGAQRSGSTLLRLMLDHHPQVACMDEFNYVLGALNPDGSEPDRDTFHWRLSNTRNYRYSGIRLDPELECSEGILGMLHALRLRDAPSKPVFGVTIHFRYREALRYWPQAKFIHLIRDPRDVAPSVIGMGWAGTAWHATRLWLDSERQVKELAGVVPEGTILRVRFEDLVRRPTEELARICSFLGVAYDPRMLSYPADTTYPAPDASAAARWRTRMPEREVREVEARTTEQLRRRGYELSGLPPFRPSVASRCSLAVRDKSARIRFRLRRFGLRLVLAHAVANRLGLHGLAMRSRRRMDDIVQSRLR